MTRFKNWKYPKMVHGEFTKWKWIAYHPENIIMGENVDIGALSLLFAHHQIIIGDNVQIGARTTIYTINTENQTEGPVRIRKDAKIGAHSIIFPNVVIEPEERIPAMSIIYINKKGERVIRR